MVKIKNLGRLWLAYTELKGDFYMLQLISIEPTKYKYHIRMWAGYSANSYSV